MTWSPRRARWFLVAAHVPFVLTAPIYAITGLDGPAARFPAVPLLAGLGAGALQLWHSLAAARGVRPDGWRWTLGALILLVYLPLPWLRANWIDAQLFVVASAIMLLRGRARIVVVALPVAGTLVAQLLSTPPHHSAAAVSVWAVLWLTAGYTIGVVSLCGSAWLVRVIDELHATRAELADVAVGRERLRVSRDLHDLLGQGLSAVSLQGDLALRLLPRDTAAARAQIETLTLVARETLAGMRAVTRDVHAVSLIRETGGVTGLLAAAGIDARVDVDLPALPADVQEVLAWAVREGVTNVLRHSDATHCSITAGYRRDRAVLTIVNDGVRAPACEGSGLAGLSARAGTLSGTVTARAARGRFELVVDVPVRARR